MLGILNKRVALGLPERLFSFGHAFDSPEKSTGVNNCVLGS